MSNQIESKLGYTITIIDSISVFMRFTDDFSALDSVVYNAFTDFHSLASVLYRNSGKAILTFRNYR